MYNICFRKDKEEAMQVKDSVSIIMNGRVWKKLKGVLDRTLLFHLMGGERFIYIVKMTKLYKWIISYPFRDKKAWPHLNLPSNSSPVSSSPLRDHSKELQSIVLNKMIQLYAANYGSMHKNHWWKHDLSCIFVVMVV